jgi:nitroreductase
MPRQHMVPSVGREGDEPLRSSRIMETEDLPRLLIRYAIMAPSSHNLQPWRFRVGEDRIDLFADLERWKPMAGRRELHLALGAALENLLLAAEHFGFRHDVAYFPDPSNEDWVARVCLKVDVDRHQPSLFAAIPRRRTNRRQYSGELIDSGLLSDLAVVAWDSGVWAWTATGADERTRIGELVARGDHVELDLPRPLSGIGRFAATRMGLGARVAQRDAGLVESAAALLVVITKDDSALSQLRAGRAMERVWLLATQFGMALQPMNQPLNSPELRAGLAELIGAGDSAPQYLFRIGYAHPETHRAPRRAVEEVLLDPNAH